MNGIYPDYVGPTIEYRFRSLYPDWVGYNLFEITVETPGGSGSKRQSDNLKSTALGRRLLREDEEVTAVILAAMRILQ
jgi:hypothetical protein